jgi:DNA invertase Pin-like site-specific DNA recombinase
LAWHPDRLARNSVDGGKVIYLVDTGVISEMKFPTFWFDPTPQGKFMLSIAFSQSKYYVDNLSENIKRGHRNKVKEGIWPQMSPLGYVNKNKRIVPDPEIAPLIKKTFEAYATGSFTLRELRDKFNALGLKRKVCSDYDRWYLDNGSSGCAIKLLKSNRIYPIQLFTDSFE